MLTTPASLMIYIATRPVDFRKGAEGLALLAKETLGHDPMKGVAVVFRAKRADRVVSPKSRDDANRYERRDRVCYSEPRTKS